MKTFVANPDNIERKWYIVDATDLVLGRLASETAKILRGKHKPSYTPFLDTGDHVIIINADKVKLTGKKLDTKVLRYHTMNPGGYREIAYRKLMALNPEKAVMHAVKGMLPHNRLGRQMLKKLRIYRGAEHQHAAQQPEVLSL